MQFSRESDTKFVAMHMIQSFSILNICIYPTTLILHFACIYTPKSIFGVAICAHIREIGLCLYPTVLSFPHNSENCEI